ncbi:MAG TPA: glycosyltransferase family 39 protein [Iamia sp.]|nr:glycosyltransferase family 39 protein [Iamia sp.]
MPAPTVSPSRAPAPEGSDERSRPTDGLVLVAAGAVVALAVGWAAGRSGAAAGTLGRGLGRLDGAAGVLLLVAAAAAQLAVTTRALGGSAMPAPRAWAVRVVRGVLVPWWVVLTVALFLFPTAPGALVPDDMATPTWVVVVREWLVAGGLAPPDGGVLAPASAGRLGLGWVVATLLVGAALLPLWERALRRAGGDPVGRAVTGGLALGAAGLLVRLAAATTDPEGWGIVARAMPPAQLDLIGVGIVVGALGAAARRGRGPLAAVDRRLAAGAAALLALAALAGLASPDVGSLIDPGGVVRTLVARVLVAGIGAALAVLALTSPPSSVGNRTPRWQVPHRARGGIVPAVAVIPLAAQLWSLRAGGAPGTQRLGPLVIVTVLGTIAVGLGGSAVLRRLFGADLGRRLSPFGARLAVVTGGALAWRLLTLVSINRVNPTGGDPFYYHNQANMLADRVGYSEPFRYVRFGVEVPSAIHPPLMSTWLSVASFLGGRTYLAHKTMSALLGVLVVVAAALIARRLAGDRAGIVAAVLVAAYPNLWVIDGVLWPEGIYTALIGFAVLAAYRWWERPAVGPAALLGLAIGLAALTRGEALFLYPLLVAPLVLFRRGVAWGPKIRAVAVVGLVGLVLFVPWTIRNQRAFGTLVILSTNGDEVLYYANCPDSYGGEFVGYWSFECQDRERRATGEPVGNEAEKARYWRDKGEAYARAHKGEIPKVVAARILRGVDLFRPGQNVLIQRVEGRPEMATRTGQWAWWALAPIGVAGLVLLRRRGVLVWPLVSLGVMVLVTMVYAYGTTRFRTPLELALLVAAAVAIVHVAGRDTPAPEPEGETS